MTLISGVFVGWISLPNMLANVHAHALSRGGRLEIEGSRFLRATARHMLKDVGAVSINGMGPDRDLFFTSRRR